MKINIQLEKNFTTQINRLKEKYGDRFTEIMGISDDKLNFNEFIDNFMDAGKDLSDISVNPTSNAIRKDIVSLLHEMGEPHQKLLALRKLYYELSKKFSKRDADRWLESIWNGSIYMHDLSTSTMYPYCWAMTLKPVVEKGLFFIDQFPTRPAAHLTTFCDHVLETISWMSNRQSGAIGVPDLLVYMYYYWQKDIKNNHYIRDPEYYARQCIQKVLYDLNQPYLRIIQSAFTNISIMDHEYLIGLFGGEDFPDGEPMMDHIDGIIEFEKLFVKQFHETRKEHCFTFPVITYSLLYSDDTQSFVDEEFARWCSDENSYWMDGNFFEGRDITSLSSCCRLINDTSKLTGWTNSIGGSALNIGSCKVSTINLRRISLETLASMRYMRFDNPDEKFQFIRDRYLEILQDRANINLQGLEVQRGIIRRNIEKGLLPNYSYGLMNLNKQYSTIGITGLYEALDELNLIEEDAFGEKSYSELAKSLACDILDELNRIKDEWASARDYSINIEAVPGETCNVKLAEMDKLLYKKAKNCYILGNQWIPLREHCSLNEKIELGAMLDSKCNGGQIMHANVEGNFADKEQAWELLNEMARRKVIYFAFNGKIKTCEDNHYWVGSDTCPTCGKKVSEEYTRIVGFFRPVKSFSKERKKEYTERTWYNL